MKKIERPTRHQILQEFNALVTIDLPYGELDKIIDNANGFCDTSYEAGYNVGKQDGGDEYESENPPINEEKLCTEYVVEKFVECISLQDFQEVYNELRNISYTYMR